MNGQGGSDGSARTGGGCGCLFAVLIVLFIIGATIYSQNNPQWSASKAPPASQTLTVGDVGTLKDTGDGHPCFASKESLDAAINAEIAHDQIGFRQQLAAHAVLLAPGDRLRVIGYDGPLFSVMNLRVESGDHIGASCWTPSEVGRDLKDVRSGDASP